MAVSFLITSTSVIMAKLVIQLCTKKLTRVSVYSVGTSVEHHALYQYQLVNTRDIFMGHIQTETP